MTSSLLQSADVLLSDVLARQPRLLLICLIVLIDLVAICTIIKYRLHYLSEKIKRRAKARADQRIHISQDINDKLLQGVQAILLLFHVAARRLPNENLTRKELEESLNKADAILSQARERVIGLRTVESISADFAETLKSIATELIGESNTTITTVSQGRKRALSADAIDELLSIGREAILGFLKHGATSAINISLTYQGIQFSLAVDADSELEKVQQPIPADLVDRIERQCMTISGRSTLSLLPNGRRVLTVAIPAEVAYEEHSRLGRWLGLMRSV